MTNVPPVSDLTTQIGQYASWRDSVVRLLRRYTDWTVSAGLSDSGVLQRTERTVRRLQNDRLNVAFVAEFSRGKSELINALFFGEYGRRLLPSSVGRTTMCPTEILYDASLPPCIRLLPIETRAGGRTTDDFRSDTAAWTTLPLNIDSVDAMLESFAQVSRTRLVPAAEAASYGLYDDEEDNQTTVDGMVQISYWRHAIVNFPHPLLKSGLTIVDTPGLNAIGTEPELTLNIIPDAHIVLFLLAADTGVTRSDADIWNTHIRPGAGRMVVLNKIDSMWDELNTPAEVDRQIERQVGQVAQTLGLHVDQIFPVSAQKGLVAKINHIPWLLERSRLPLLEQALTRKLLPAKRMIVGDELAREIDGLTASRQTILSGLTRACIEQLVELKSLRGKNANVVEHMLRRIDAEKQEFDLSLTTLQETRIVFSRLAVDVFRAVGLGSLKQDFEVARSATRRTHLAGSFRTVVSRFFAQVRDNLLTSSEKTEEISTMMTSTYRAFSNGHGLSLPAPAPFSMSKYIHQLNMIEEAYLEQFSTLMILKSGRETRNARFFDTVGSRIRLNMLQANREAEAWLKTVMSPLEDQIRTHNRQLKNRIESIVRIQQAIDTLEDKIAAVEQRHEQLQSQRATMTSLEIDLKRVVDAVPSAAIQNHIAGSDIQGVH